MVNTNVKIDLCVDCLNCPKLDVLYNTVKFYQHFGSDPELFGRITCAHDLVCPNLVGKEKISELISKMINS